MWWMAMLSLPSGRVITVGRFVTVSVDRIPTLGTLMIGAVMNDPDVDVPRVLERALRERYAQAAELARAELGAAKGGS
mgnify:CR=1 FL=1